MSKLREIADKLGLPIEKPFKIENSISDLTFKINEKGEMLFYHEENEKWLISVWSLVDVYVKGFVLIDDSNDIKDLDKVYLTLVLEMSEAFIRYQEDLLSKTNDIIIISNIKRQDNKIKFILEETKRRLLNK